MFPPPSHLRVIVIAALLALPLAPLVPAAALSPPSPAGSGHPAADAAHPEPMAGGDGTWGPGPYEVLRQEYDFGDVPLTNPFTGTQLPSRVAGSVHSPAAGPGPFPVVVFMHGRHDTCAIAGVEVIGLMRLCESRLVVEPVRNYAGYDYIAEHLASRGYVVISVNANDINDVDLVPNQGMDERAALLLHTLDRFREMNATAGPEPFGDGLVGRLDMGRVGLMGHSRGGEGAARAVTMNQARPAETRHSLVGVFAIAPTDFYRQRIPDVHFATLVPYCDGDVTDLEGMWLYDDNRYLPGDAGARTLLVAMGANHGFYNTEWWFDDANYDPYAFDDPYCGTSLGTYGPGTGRLTADDQRRHALVYVAAFFRHRLGGEAALGALLRGEAPPPAEACPAGQASCPGLLKVSYHAPEGDRRVVEDTLDDGALSGNDLGGETRLTGFVEVSACMTTSCPSQPNYARAPQVTLVWEGPATFTTALPVGAGDVRGFGFLSLRGGLNFYDERNPVDAEQDFRLVLTDANGTTRSVRVGDFGDAFFYPPGVKAQKLLLTATRVPLSAFEGVDLGSVRSVSLVFDATPSGSIQWTDLMFQR